MNWHHPGSPQGEEHLKLSPEATAAKCHPSRPIQLHRCVSFNIHSGDGEDGENGGGGGGGDEKEKGGKRT